jgi:hypothetical protein
VFMNSNITVRSLLAGTICVLVIGLMGESASAQQPAGLSLSPSSGPAGSTVTISGNFFPKRTSVALTWKGSSYGMPTAVTAPSGAFSVLFTIPSAANPGSNAIGANANGVTANVTFQVVTTAPVLATSTPPATATSAPTAAPVSTPAATPSSTTRTGTVYFQGDWSTGDMSQYNGHQAGNQLVPKPSTWDGRTQVNGNSSVSVQAAIARPGYPYAAKFDLFPNSEVQSIIATGATAGTFTLSWAGSTTAAIAYNASQETIAAALNAMSSIQSVGGVVCHAGNDQDGNTLNALPNSPIYIVFKQPGHGGTPFTTNSTGLAGGTVSVTGGISPSQNNATNNKWGSTLSSAAWVVDGNDVYYGMSLYFPSGISYSSPLLWELGYPLSSTNLSTKQMFNNGGDISPNGSGTNPYLRVELDQDGSGNLAGVGVLPAAFLWSDTDGLANLGQLNTWIDLVVHTKWSSTSNGLFEVWKNGIKVHSGSGRTLPSSPSFSGAQDLEIANYHGGDNTTMYATAIRIGNSYSAVAP